jgi:hypothetical protein
VGRGLLSEQIGSNSVYVVELLNVFGLLSQLSLRAVHSEGELLCHDETRPQQVIQHQGG